ncbi:MAG: hypothetical protein ACFFED_18095, partial [Candidatus Thorarchaeota archaeon]
PEETGTVPLLGWSVSMTYLVFWVVIPLAGSILSILLVPRILAPLFMVIKKALNRGYSDGYVDIDVSSMGGKKMLMRMIYVYLLIIALVTTVGSLFDATQFLPTGGFPSPIDPQYNISFIFCMTGITAPLAVALWSVGWAMEDASLIHYKLPAKEKGELYEIEPVYKTYSSYLKGFAGFSTILSLFVIFNYFMGISRPEDAISVFLVPFHGMLVIIPAYFIFVVIGSKWLRKSKREVKHLTENDLNLYVE